MLLFGAETRLNDPNPSAFDSLGDGHTIKAHGWAYGVNVFSAHGCGWTTGALIPGLKYGG